MYFGCFVVNSSAMSIARPTTRVFVDFENVSDIDLTLITGLPVHVTLLLGKKQQKLDLALVKQIHRLADQVDLVEIGATGRNALDMTLAYYLGRAIQQNRRDQFCIVSGDKDYDALIQHLLSHDHQVARYGSFHLIPGLPKPKKSAATKVKKTEPTPVKKTPQVDRDTKLMARLKNPKNSSRPSSSSALVAEIKAKLGPELSDAEVTKFIDRLVKAKVLRIDTKDRVLYTS